MNPGWKAEIPTGEQRVLLHEGGYRVCTVEGDQLEEAYRLRYDVFCRGLGWVVRCEGGRETDSYDESAVHFGVYGEDGALAAYIRVILPACRFMLEDVFSHLLGEYPLVRKEKDTAEVSRLCVAPGSRDDKVVPGGSGLVMLLFRGLRRWCEDAGIRFLYAVAEERVCKAYYRKGLRFRVMGEPADTAEGQVVRVAVLDWREQGSLVR